MYNGVSHFLDENQRSCLHIVSLSKRGLEFEVELAEEINDIKDDFDVFLYIQSLRKANYYPICFSSYSSRLMSQENSIDFIVPDNNKDWLDKMAQLWFPSYSFLPGTKAYPLAVYCALYNLMC